MTDPIFAHVRVGFPFLNLTEFTSHAISMFVRSGAEKVPMKLFFLAAGTVETERILGGYWYVGIDVVKPFFGGIVCR